MKTRDEVSVPLSDLPNQAKVGHNYLLIIAVDDYQNGIPALHNAVRDAQAFQNVMLQQYQFEPQHCYTLLNQAATLRSFDLQFAELNQTLTEVDNLVFYFSGHGTLSQERQQGYWLLQDAHKGDYTTYLSNATVLQFIKACPARHVYGIVDACFSGALFRDLDPSPPSRLYQYRSRFLLTAGREERVLDGAPGQNSPFADTLLQQLSDPSRQEIWGVDLARNVLKYIQYQTEEQMPRGDYLKDTRHAGGEMVFLKKGTELKAITTTPPAEDIEGQGLPSTPSIQQNADKIYNIDHIDRAEFS